MQTHFHPLTLDTESGIHVIDITHHIRQLIAETGLQNGFAVVSSFHTTTAITINENEERLLQDMDCYFLQLAPPDAGYLHNDIHLRDCPPDEPENAHSHLMAMILGQSECIPIQNAQLMLGKWQSVMLVELDGPRQRTVNIQLNGN